MSSQNGSLISDFGIDRPFIVSSGYLYFVDTVSQNRLFRLPVNGTRSLDKQAAELIIDDVVSSFVLCGDFVYYQRPDSNRIYRVAASGGQQLRIA